MSRSKQIVALALLAALAYVAALIAIAVRQGTAPVDAAALSYRQQQVRSFALEGVLLTKETASGATWDQFRKGAAQMLQQQSAALEQDLSTAEFAPAVAARGRNLAVVAAAVTLALGRLSAPQVSASEADAIGSDLKRLAAQAEQL